MLTWPSWYHGDFLWLKLYNDNSKDKDNKDNNDIIIIIIIIIINNQNNNNNNNNNNKAMIAIYLSAQRLYIPYIEYLARI